METQKNDGLVRCGQRDLGRVRSDGPAARHMEGSILGYAGLFDLVSIFPTIGHEIV